VGRPIETTSPGISSIPESFTHLHHKWGTCQGINTGPHILCYTLPLGYTLIYTEIGWDILPTTVNHECLTVYSNTPQLCQCPEPAIDHSWFKEHQHEQCENTIQPVIIQTPKSNTENLSHVHRYLLVQSCDIKKKCESTMTDRCSISHKKGSNLYCRLKISSTSKSKEIYHQRKTKEHKKRENDLY
jgi:hypothetical protein